jgi:hypothetical protein
VGVVDRKAKLFHHIVRLRRAAREAPNNRDIAAVRSALEQELGETVSRRLAASLLGVSHTALGRWIAAGDLPTVYNADGRVEVPVAALLDLYDAVEHEREHGQRTRHLLEPTMTEGRRRAERLQPGALLADAAPDDLDGHRRAELRSLAYHRALARRLRRPRVDDARQVLWKWREQRRIDPRYADQWETVLRRPVAEIKALISADTPEGRDLRQNSPFAGMLTEAERRRILQDVG